LNNSSKLVMFTGMFLFSLHCWRIMKKNSTDLLDIFGDASKVISSVFIYYMFDIRKVIYYKISRTLRFIFIHFQFFFHFRNLSLSRLDIWNNKLNKSIDTLLMSNPNTTIDKLLRCLLSVPTCRNCTTFSCLEKCH